MSTQFDLLAAFAPLRSDFYAYCSAHGLPSCPQIVPVLECCQEGGQVVAIKITLDTYWGYTEGIGGPVPQDIYPLFAQYMREKGFGDDVFSIDTPEKAEVFLARKQELGW